MARELICRDCGMVGKPGKRTQGSFTVELLLWLFFCLPGLIYTAWRLTSKLRVCRYCGSQALVQLGSPVGQRLLEELHEEDEDGEYEDEEG